MNSSAVVSPIFFRQSVFIRVKTRCIANMAESRYIKRDKASLQFDMYRSETPVLKLANTMTTAGNDDVLFIYNNVHGLKLPNTTTTAGNDDVLFIYNNVHGFRLWVIYPTHTSGVSSSPTLQGSFGSFWPDRDQGTVRPASKRVYGKISRGCEVILLRIHS